MRLAAAAARLDGMKCLPLGLEQDGCLQFYLERPSRGLWAVVERHSVILPTCGRPEAEQDYETWLHDRLNDLVARNRAAARRDGGPDDESALRQLDCAPAFGRWSAAAERANPYTIGACYGRHCIHCHARRAIEHWETVDAALFPRDERGRRPHHADVDVIIAVRTIRTRGWRAYRRADGTRDLERAINDRLGKRKGAGGRIPGRGYENRMLPALGRIENIVLKPEWVKGRDGTQIIRWTMQIRQLLAVRPGQAVKIPGAKITRISRPNANQVAAAVGRCFRYAATLLPKINYGADDKFRDGPHSLILPTFRKVTAGRRLIATSGAFTSTLAASARTQLQPTPPTTAASAPTRVESASHKQTQVPEVATLRSTSEPLVSDPGTDSPCGRVQPGSETKTREREPAADVRLTPPVSFSHASGTTRFRPGSAFGHCRPRLTIEPRLAYGGPRLAYGGPRQTTSPRLTTRAASLALRASSRPAICSPSPGRIRHGGPASLALRAP
jgi:hypothetical protein